MFIFFYFKLLWIVFICFLSKNFYSLFVAHIRSDIWRFIECYSSYKIFSHFRLNPKTAMLCQAYEKSMSNVFLFATILLQCDTELWFIIRCTQAHFLSFVILFFFSISLLILLLFFLLVVALFCVVVVVFYCSSPQMK